jgi:nucleoside-diphosphate kinase
LNERTFSIVKPDAVGAGKAGRILSRLETSGFRIVALRMRHLTRPEAEGFYYVHKERPFFSSLCDFMSSGPCITLVLERENAISNLREIMGATDPAKAADGTIRKDFATSIEQNAIHGSDAPDTARFESGYFFPGIETRTSS